MLPSPFVSGKSHQAMIIVTIPLEISLLEHLGP